MSASEPNAARRRDPGRAGASEAAACDLRLTRSQKIHKIAAAPAASGTEDSFLLPSVFYFVHNFKNELSGGNHASGTAVQKAGRH